MTCSALLQRCKSPEALHLPACSIAAHIPLHLYHLPFTLTSRILFIQGFEISDEKSPHIRLSNVKLILRAGQPASAAENMRSLHESQATMRPRPTLVLAVFTAENRLRVSKSAVRQIEVIGSTPHSAELWITSAGKRPDSRRCDPCSRHSGRLYG